MKQRFTFRKEERLSGKKQIDELFNSGSSFYLAPFKVVTAPLHQHNKDEAALNRFAAQVLFTVSSRNFPRAVDRNKIKRRMREAYRLNKHELYDALEKRNQKLAVAFIYTSKEVEPTAVIQERLTASLKKIISQL